MEKLIKLFPLMPAAKDGGKLAVAILFYVFVPWLVSLVIAIVLGITIILSPRAVLVGLVGNAYTIMGIVFAIMSYCGKPLPGTAATAEEETVE